MADPLNHPEQANASPEWVLVPRELVEAAKKMPRATPGPGAGSTVHMIGIEAAVIWELDRALMILEGKRDPNGLLRSTPKPAPGDAAKQLVAIELLKREADEWRRAERETQDDDTRERSKAHANLLYEMIRRIRHESAQHTAPVLTEEERAAVTLGHKLDSKSAMAADTWRSEYDTNRADLLDIISRITGTHHG